MEGKHSTNGLSTLNEEEIEEYLLEKGICIEVASDFRKNLVTGEAFLKLTEEDLKELVPLVGVRTRIRDLLKNALLDISECSVTESSNGKTESQLVHINDDPSLLGLKASVNWHLSFRIPDVHTFSECVQKAIGGGMVSSKARREIVQTLRTHILQHTKYMSSEQYITISRKLVTKYPKLRDTLGTNGYGSWKESLRNSFKNFRRGQSSPDQTFKKSNSEIPEPPLKRLKTTMDDELPIEEDYDSAVTELAEEWGKGKKKRNMSTVKDLMSTTDKGRRTWITKERPLITEILSKFPCLGNSRMIRRDFRDLLDLEEQVSSLKDKWQYWMEQVIKVAQSESSSRPAIKKLLDNTPDVNSDDDECNAVVLELLMKLLYPRGPGKNWIFIKNVETCDIDLKHEVQAVAQSAPYIVVLGQAGSDTVQYFICGEKVVICESKSILDAITDLIGAYYIFDIVYPRALTGIFLFFQHHVFAIRDDQVVPPCLLKLIKNIHSFVEE